MRVLAGALCAIATVVATLDIAEAARLETAAVRAFILAQDQAWERRDFERYYSTFDPNAVIVIVQMSKGAEISRSLHSVEGDRQRAERFFASRHARVSETDEIESIALSPDGTKARVRVKEIAEVRKNGQRKQLHATTEQELALRSGKIVSLKLTEYDER